MEKLNYKKILINSVLFFLILIVLGYNFYYFVIAPKLQSDLFIKNLTQHVDKEAQFINQFNFEQEFYLLQIKDQFVAVNCQGEVLNKINAFSLKDGESLGFVNNEFILVIKNKVKEQWFSIDDHQLIFELEK